MAIGIEALNVYAGRCYLEIADLSRARGFDFEYIRQEFACLQRSVFPPWEDAVTLAVNAAAPIVNDDLREQVDLLIVASETGVDYSKPLSTWVHRHLGLVSRCRTFELKHACYGSTAALKIAASFIGRGRKAIVINADYSRLAAFGDPREPQAGGVGVAMVVSDEPHVLELEPGAEGYWTAELHDFVRPTPRVERIVEDGTSVYAYLDALEGAYAHFEDRVGPVEYERDFRAHIYHAPFPAMGLLAHRAMLQRLGVCDHARISSSIRERVAPGLSFGSRIGTMYGGSTFVSLLGLLGFASELRAHDPISIFAYGAGSQGEFYRSRIGASALERADARALERALDARLRLSVDEYEGLEAFYDRHADRSTYDALEADSSDVFARSYAGTGLLVLEGLTDYARHYVTA
jgi:hydroxymethylglutaryl-CoA synthase